MANTLMSLLVSIGADTSDFRKGIDAAEKQVGNFSENMTSLGKNMMKVGGAMTAGLTVPIAAFGAAAIKSAMDSESALADLDAVLSSTSSSMGTFTEEVQAFSDKSAEKMTKDLEAAAEKLKIMQMRYEALENPTEVQTYLLEQQMEKVEDLTEAVSHLGDTTTITTTRTQMSRDSLIELSAALQKTTMFSDETILSAESMLLTFTNIGKKVFPEATMATLDMAQKFGMDATQAAITLGKALNDPIAGVTALRRIGVMLTEQQEDQIKSFMAVGNIAAAQKVILDELAIEIGGVAEAAGATTAGKMAQFMNQLDDMKEIIGVALIPVLIRLIEAITPLIIKFAEADPATQNLIIGLVAFVAAIGPVVTAVGGIVTAVGALTPVLTTLFTFITATAIPALVAFAVANAAWLIPLGLVIAAAGLLYYAWKTNFGGFATTVKQLWFIISYYFGQIIMTIDNAVNSMLGFLGISQPTGSYPGYGPQAVARANGGNRALGGSVFAGTPYTVGEHGMETFVPNTNGKIVPNNTADGQNITIINNITNPKREAAEDSIRKSLKSLSYMGVATA